LPANDGHDRPRFLESFDLVRAIGWQNFRPYVFDIQGTSDRFAGLARVSGQQDWLDSCVMQKLYGGSCPRPKPILKRNDPDKSPGYRDDQYGSSMGFEFSKLGFNRGHRDVLAK